MSETHTVELTDYQIRFLRTCLDYSARRFREDDYGPDYEFGRQERLHAERMISSIGAALLRGRRWGKTSGFLG